MSSKEFEQYKIDYKEDYEKHFSQLYVIGLTDLKGLNHIPLAIGTSNKPEDILKALQANSELKLTFYTLIKPQATRSALGIIKKIYENRDEAFEWINLDYDLLTKLRKYGLIKQYEGEALLKKLNKINKVLDLVKA